MKKVIRKQVCCKFTVPGFHHWPDAPEQHSYLRSPHRHLFHFKVSVDIFDSNREIEFISLRDLLVRTILDLYWRKELTSNTGLSETVDFGARSCEMIAEELRVKLWDAHKICSSKISVFEDNENGAVITWDNLLFAEIEGGMIYDGGKLYEAENEELN